MILRARFAAVGAVVLGVGVLGAVAAHAAQPALSGPVTAKPLTGWSQVIDDGGEGVRAQAKFRIIQIDKNCFVQALASTGGGGIDLTPTTCP